MYHKHGAGFRTPSQDGKCDSLRKTIVVDVPQLYRMVSASVDGFQLAFWKVSPEKSWCSTCKDVCWDSFSIFSARLCLEP